MITTFGISNTKLRIVTAGIGLTVSAVALAVAISPDFFIAQPLQTLHLLVSDIEHRNYRIASIGAGIKITEVD